MTNLLFLLGGMLIGFIARWAGDRYGNTDWAENVPAQPAAPEQARDIPPPPSTIETRIEGEINHNIHIEREEDDADWWKRCDP